MTVEPGGQLEISTPPRPSLAALIAPPTADIAQLTGLLRRRRPGLGRSGIDPHRRAPPGRRHPALPRHARRLRPARPGRPDHDVQHRRPPGLPGRRASRTQVAARWAAAHAVGPAAARRVRHRRPARRAAHRLGLRPDGGLAGHRPGPHPAGLVARPADADPVAAWAGYALDAPLLCLRRDGADWAAPPGLTFADWLDRRRCPARPPPTTSTTTSARCSRRSGPRGYLELRYLDAQPGPDWLAPAGRAGRPASPTRGTVDAAPRASPRRWRPLVRRRPARPGRPGAGAPPPPACSTWRCAALPRLDLPAALHDEIRARALLPAAGRRDERR